MSAVPAEVPISATTGTEFASGRGEKLESLATSGRAPLRAVGAALVAVDSHLSRRRSPVASSGLPAFPVPAAASPAAAAPPAAIPPSAAGPATGPGGEAEVRGAQGRQPRRPRPLVAATRRQADGPRQEGLPAPGLSRHPAVSAPPPFPTSPPVATPAPSTPAPTNPAPAHIALGSGPADRPLRRPSASAAVIPQARRRAPDNSPSVASVPGRPTTPGPPAEAGRPARPASVAPYRRPEVRAAAVDPRPLPLTPDALAAAALAATPPPAPMSAPRPAVLAAPRPAALAAPRPAAAVAGSREAPGAHHVAPSVLTAASLAAAAQGALPPRPSAAPPPPAEGASTPLRPSPVPVSAGLQADDDDVSFPVELDVLADRNGAVVCEEDAWKRWVAGQDEDRQARMDADLGRHGRASGRLGALLGGRPRGAHAASRTATGVS